LNKNMTQEYSTCSTTWMRRAQEGNVNFSICKNGETPILKPQIHPGDTDIWFTRSD
jgi:hypothetical protein